MKLKRIDYTGLTVGEVGAAQAQLEASEKEATEKEQMWQGYTEMAKLEVARVIFEETERSFFGEGMQSYFTLDLFQALKQSILKKYGGEK